MFGIGLGDMSTIPVVDVALEMVLDISMPGKKNINVIERLKQRNRLAPVLILIGSLDISHFVEK